MSNSDFYCTFRYKDLWFNVYDHYKNLVCNSITNILIVSDITSLKVNKNDLTRGAIDTWSSPSTNFSIAICWSPSTTLVNTHVIFTWCTCWWTSIFIEISSAFVSWSRNICGKSIVYWLASFWDNSKNKTVTYVAITFYLPVHFPRFGSWWKPSIVQLLDSSLLTYLVQYFLKKSRIMIFISYCFNFS